MPRLPKGMYRKGRALYFRTWEGGRDRWIPLGSDLEAATAKLRELRAKPLPSGSLTVADLADKWLATYTAITRTAEGRRHAAQRFGTI